MGKADGRVRDVVIALLPIVQRRQSAVPDASRHRGVTQSKKLRAALADDGFGLSIAPVKDEGSSVHW